MIPSPQLEPMLRKLRLSGILDSLESRNKQAIEQGLAFTDFLGILIQDEVARRDQKKFDSRFRRANFRGNKTIESYNFSYCPKAHQSLIRDLATCKFIEEKANVLIAGPCGTGKSHIAEALGQCAIRKDFDALFITLTQLLGQLHAARATGSYEKKLQYFATVDCLTIDDFGLKPMKSPQDEDFHDLISERYERKSTILTSNLDYPEWGDAFPNRLLGAATLDRLRHGAYRLTLEGKSYRSPKGENTSEKGLE